MTIWYIACSKWIMCRHATNTNSHQMCFPSCEKPRLWSCWSPQTSADISCSLKSAPEIPHLRWNYQTAGINKDRLGMIFPFCSGKCLLFCGNEKAWQNIPFSFGHINTDGSRQSEAHLRLQDILTVGGPRGCDPAQWKHLAWSSVVEMRITEAWLASFDSHCWTTMSFYDSLKANNVHRKYQKLS